MGKIFNTNTWRAPLQLIDCWLPSPSIRQATAANEPLVTRAVQRFTRAGWLKREGPCGSTTHRDETTDAPKAASGLRVIRQTRSSASTGVRVGLVIAGPINDVCAELDRLADQERRLTSRVA